MRNPQIKLTDDKKLKIDETSMKKHLHTFKGMFSEKR